LELEREEYEGILREQEVLENCEVLLKSSYQGNTYNDGSNGGTSDDTKYQPNIQYTDIQSNQKKVDQTLAMEEKV